MAHLRFVLDKLQYARIALTAHYCKPLNPRPQSRAHVRPTSCQSHPAAHETIACGYGDCNLLQLGTSQGRLSGTDISGVVVTVLRVQVELPAHDPAIKIDESDGKWAESWRARTALWCLFQASVAHPWLLSGRRACPPLP